MSPTFTRCLSTTADASRASSKTTNPKPVTALMNTFARTVLYSFTASRRSASVVLRGKFVNRTVFGSTERSKSLHDVVGRRPRRAHADVFGPRRTPSAVRERGREGEREREDEREKESEKEREKESE